MKPVNAVPVTESISTSALLPAAGPACPGCGTRFNPRSTATLCPACLMTAVLAAEPDDAPAEPDQGDAQAPRSFSDFELLGEAGRGGMGVVYRARQRGVNRIVALKLLQPGRMISSSEVQRFQQESGVIARLEHPGILPLYSAGEHQGQPWCAVKWMDGGSLAQRMSEFRLPAEGRDEVCDKGSNSTRIYRVGSTSPIAPSTPDSIAVFLRKLALAIQHAHQRGVLHRDLKPGNILLDSDNEPAVADFGLARTLDSDSALTRTGAFFGSPAYTAPEQAASDGREVTVAADIYGLGGILYELLTGQPPFTGKDTFDTLRHVVESTPTPPRTLNPNVPPDLDTICLKCLEKEPSKRYATAQALADDLERFLNDEPILARPVTRLERAVRWCRRKPALASAYGLLLFLVLLLSIASPIAAYRINEARRAESTARDWAQVEANNALSILGFLKDDLLVLADPYRSAEAERTSDRDLSLKAAILDAALRIDSRFENQPLVEAELRLIIGRALERLGEMDAATLELEQAASLYAHHLGPESLATLAAEEGLAWVAFHRGDAIQAATTHAHILDLRRALLPAGSPEIFHSMNAVATARAADPVHYADAAELFGRVIREATPILGMGHSVVLTAKQGLSDIYYQTGPWDEAIRLRHEVADAITSALGADHPDAIRAMANRVLDLRYHAADYWAAERLSEEVLPRAQRVLGKDSQVVRLLLHEQSHRDKVRGLWGTAIERRLGLLNQIRQKHTPADPETLWAEDMLGGAFRAFGDSAEAERIHRRSTEIRLQTGQTQTIGEQRSLRYLGWALFHLGRFEEAEACYREIIEQNVPVFGRTNVRRIYNAGSLVRMIASQGKWEEIARLYQDMGMASLENPSGHQPFGPLHTPAGILAAELSGDFQLSDQLSTAVLAFAHNSTDRLVRDNTSDFLLTLPTHRLRDENRQRLENLAHEVASSAEGPLRRSWINGALAHRTGQHADAAAILQPLTLNPDNLIAARAGFFLATALQAQGSIPDAAAALDTANVRFQIALRPGLLGHAGQRDFGYDVGWADYAACLLLRDEAEAAVLGAVHSDRVDTAWLAAARESWAPTRDILNEAESHGRRRSWSEARTAYLRAMDTGPINWDLHGTFTIELPLKVATTFALTGEHDRYRALCQELLQHADETQFYYASVVLVMPEALDSAVLEQARCILRRATAMLNDSGTSRLQDDWLWLNLGIAEAHGGNIQEALSALAKAQGAFNLTRAGIAFASSAALLARQGNAAEAQPFLGKAVELHQRILDGNPSSLSHHWHEVARLELALNRTSQPLAR